MYVTFRVLTVVFSQIKQAFFHGFKQGDWSYLWLALSSVVTRYLKKFWSYLSNPTAFDTRPRSALDRGDLTF